MPQWTKWDKSTIRTFVGQLSKNHRTKGLHGIISVHHTHIREQSTVECALTQSISTVSIFNRFFPLLLPLGDNKCLSFGSRFTEFGGFQLVSTLISPPKNHIIENVSAIDWNEWGEGICMSHHKSCIAGVITLRWSLHRIYASSPIFSHSIRFVFVAHFFVNQNFGLYTIRFKPTALFCQSTNEHWWSEFKIHKHTHNNEQIYGTTVHFRHSHWNRFADMALELWSTSPPMCYIIRFICKLNAAPYLCFFRLSRVNVPGIGGAAFTQPNRVVYHGDYDSKGCCKQTIFVAIAPCDSCRVCILQFSLGKVNQSINEM